MEKGGLVHFPVYRPLIDSLLKAGFTLHEMNAEDSGFNGKGNPASYWTLFRAADRTAPSGLPFYIFTKDELDHFSGNRPVTDRNIYWYTEPGRLSVSPGRQRPAIMDTGAIRITIYAENKNKPDCRYLLAAFRSLEEFTRRRVNVTVITTLQQAKRIVLPLSGRQDWLFWLSPEPFPGEIFTADTISRLSSFANILRLEQGKEVPEETWVDGMPEIWVGRMIEAPSLPDQHFAIWKDGYGRALLAMEKKSKGNRATGCRIFHFFSRFDPAWNGLVWSPSFPLLLQQLIYDPAAYGDTTEILSTAGDLSSDLSRDLRIIDPLQILPQQNQPGYTEGSESSRSLRDSIRLLTGSEPAVAGSTRVVDLAGGIWLLIFILFLLERIVSTSTAKTKSYG
jgi:hypothetical protein